MKKRPASTVDLAIERHALQQQAAEAEAEMNLADDLQQPFLRAFYEAHNALLLITERRRNGHVFPKSVIFAAYDKRMHAGHAWHPHKLRYQEALRWHTAVFKELTEIHAAISKRRPTPPPASSDDNQPLLL